jgi:hypothetical protein
MLGDLFSLVRNDPLLFREGQVYQAFPMMCKIRYLGEGGGLLCEKLHSMPARLPLLRLRKASLAALQSAQEHWKSLGQGQG